MICPVCGVESHAFECKRCAGLLKQSDKAIFEILMDLLDIEVTKQISSKLKQKEVTNG